MEATTEPEEPPQPQREAFAIHRQMVVFLFGATILLTSCLAVSLWRLDMAHSQGRNPESGFHVTALMVVAIAGVLGGFVSALRRLYAFTPVFPTETFSFWTQRSLSYVALYSSIPPLVGAIAAVVVYLIFAGRIIQGPLFPVFDFDSRYSKDETFENFLSNWQPKETVDYAKAFVWAFIAGFSEKFVPDILNRLSQSAQDKLGKAD